MASRITLNSILDKIKAAKDSSELSSIISQLESAFEQGNTDLTDSDWPKITIAIHDKSSNASASHTSKPRSEREVVAEKAKTLNDLLPLVKYEDLDLSKPSLVRVAVDSQTAEKMLSLNKKNRIVRKAAVNYLKAQIASGEWREDHPQPVVFSSNGVLIDGQHRIYAIGDSKIPCGKGLILRVETGASHTVREYIDTGVPRSLYDRVTAIEDLQLNKIAAQLVTYRFVIKAGSKRPTPEQFKEFFAQHEESITEIANIHRNNKGVGKIQVAFAAMEFYEISPFLARSFYKNLFLADGEIQQARMLRDYLHRTSSSMASIDNTLAYRHSIYAKSVYCMKKYLAGEDVKKVLSSDW